MLNTNIATQMPKRHNKQVAPIDLLGHDPILHPVTPLDRLQLAAQGLGDVHPQDVTAIVAEVVASEAAAVNKMAGQVEQMNQLFLTQDQISQHPQLLSVIARAHGSPSSPATERVLEVRRATSSFGQPTCQTTVNVLSVTRA